MLDFVGTLSNVTVANKDSHSVTFNIKVENNVFTLTVNYNPLTNTIRSAKVSLSTVVCIGF